MASVEQLAELESLGISPNKTNECNDDNEISWLIELLKQALYEEYKAFLQFPRELSKNC
jgi:hypothetical protein